MKYIIALFTLLYALPSLGQEAFNGFELKLENGQIIKPGQHVKLGLGTAPDGSFNYITKGGNRKDKKHAYEKYLIQRIVRQGSEKRGYRYIAVIGESGSFKWNVLLKPALETKEITIVENAEFDSVSK